MNDRAAMARLAQKILERSKRLRLNLAGVRVLTEAATGAYASTPVLAAIAGADVVAFTRDSSHGSVEDVVEQTMAIARRLGVADRIRVIDGLRPEDFAAADLVTNSGHLRPIDAERVAAMKPTAVIPLMYEAWELRPTDVDLAACRTKGVAVAGTNERHPDVDVFDYLGPLALQAILQSGHEVHGEKMLLLSDNDFCHYVARTLRGAGATVDALVDPAWAVGAWDVVVVAMTPTTNGGPLVQLADVRADLFVQLWGDANRDCSPGVWRPERPPRLGHMGLSLATLGPTPIVALQAAGLKCGELMLRGEESDLLQWVVRPKSPGAREQAA